MDMVYCGIVRRLGKMIDLRWLVFKWSMGIVAVVRWMVPGSRSSVRPAVLIASEIRT
jgi:hypothetical protein